MRPLLPSGLPTTPQRGVTALSESADRPGFLSAMDEEGVVACAPTQLLARGKVMRGACVPDEGITRRKGASVRSAAVGPAPEGPRFCSAAKRVVRAEKHGTPLAACGSHLPLASDRGRAPGRRDTTRSQSDRAEQRSAPRHRCHPGRAIGAAQRGLKGAIGRVAARSALSRSHLPVRHALCYLVIRSGHFCGSTIWTTPSIGAARATKARSCARREEPMSKRKRALLASASAIAVVSPLIAGDLAAQTVPATEPGWSFAVTPYVWVPWVEGKFSYNVPERTGVAGARVNMDAINLLESLNFAVSIAGEARNGRFSILTDLIYLDFGKSSSAVRSVDFVQAGRNPVSRAVLGRGGADGAQHCWLPTGQAAAGSILVAPGERVRHERAHGRNVAPRAAVARAAVEGTWQPAHRRRPGRAGARAGGRAPRFVRASATFRRPRAMQRQ